MGLAMKRKGQPKEAQSIKKPRLCESDCLVRRALLDQHYQRVNTLRDYVISHLPTSSKVRRKKIISLVCTSKVVDVTETVRWEQWQSFSQQCDDSHATIGGNTPALRASQRDIVDFVIWQLFSEVKQAGSWPRHLLCDGFRRTGDEDARSCPGIPGIYSLHPNWNVKTIREEPWPQLLSVLGQYGEKLMIRLLTDCSIFLPAEAGFNNFYQLSGIPISELNPPGKESSGQALQSAPRKPSAITLVRSRIFYAKPALNARGSIRNGFKHIHVLNRCMHAHDFNQDKTTTKDNERDTVELQNRLNTSRLMMYMFPRQFGLHNVFTSKVDALKTAQKFQDYTTREDELKPVFQGEIASKTSPKTPKRLRGVVMQLVERLRVLHSRCSYTQLLNHYCPSRFDKTRQGQLKKPRIGKRGSAQGVSALTGHQEGPHQPSKSPNTILSVNGHASKGVDVVDLATSTAEVSAFCQAVLSTIIPNDFWGDDDIQAHNKAKFLRKVDHFVKLRRYETMNLFEISQDFKITALEWLRGPGTVGQKACRTDTEKRIEIFHEFIYFIFDSLLIPLIRTNFYVTESNTHRYDIFFFRHDVWRRIAEPATKLLKQEMFEEMKADQALSILGSRKLGYSQIRLLPKGPKLRPIMNLRRRQMKTSRSGILSPSINTVLGPVHTVLKLEKVGSHQSAPFDIYDKLKNFKAHAEPFNEPLFFAKIDVQAAFDNIPQDLVTEVMASVPSHERYRITKHAEVKPGEPMHPGASNASNKPIRRWYSTASWGNQPNSNFLRELNGRLAARKRNTLFVNSSVQQMHDTGNLLKLLDQHVRQNMVKFGKKYYRQKLGIPQGSVLSSFLCNYYYADLETKFLGFLHSPDCLLLRLIDDFLLITWDKSKAARFVETMHQDLSAFGVVVNASKTLVNFNMSIGGRAVQSIPTGHSFPYCGTLINCQTLEISKDRSKEAGNQVFSTLTVDFGQFPGQNFQRKILNAFKIQSHLMFFDTSHNSVSRALKSLRDAFTETATKMWAYMRCLPVSRQPSSDLIIRTIAKVVNVAFLLLTGQSRKSRYPNYQCEIRKTQITSYSIAYAAFLAVIHKKQTRYSDVISWLQNETLKLGSTVALPIV
ncbi:Telomerase reverse transcriptase [Paramyrothecium foliicola]|nr:Telomerase reverse transcriptase [Paramyrothecium foliicola]